MKMKVILVISFLFISYCVFPNKSDTIVLQLKWKHQFQFAGYYIAKEKGFYKELNIQVKIKEGTGSCNPVDSVLNGKAQIGIGGSELLIERNNGRPVIALLSIYQHSPLVLLSKKTNEIQNIHDIIGKRVMLETQCSELYAYLKNEGIDTKSLILYPYEANLSLLIDDKVDFISAYISDEPFTLKEKNVSFQIFSPQSAGIDFYNDILFTSDKFVKNHAKEVDAFIEASKKGWEYALRNTEETAQIIYQKYSKEKEVDNLLYEANESKKVIKNDVVEIGYMYRGRWQHIGETYVQLGMLKSDFNLDNFIYSRDKDKSQFSLLRNFFAGILILLFIIGLILASYLFNKYFDVQRTEKRKENR